jgi:erythronate-4-phosphate dehydrogenase
MKIIADQNIPLVKNVFSGIGDITLVSGRDINNAILKDCEILLVRSITKVDRSLLENTKVKFVGTATIGTDHIDVKYLDEALIKFTSAPGSNADSVAEYMVSALLNLEQKLNMSLPGKKIGIIGCGNVGSRVKRRMEVLGLNCLVCDPLLEDKQNGGDFLPLEKVLGESDIVTVHVPLEKSGRYPTLGMINDEFLSGMKNGAILFNTSRGKVMDEKALFNNSGKLSGLVLDVWLSEPQINVDTLDIADIATPHIAGYSYDGKIRGTKMLYDALCDFLAIKKECDFNEYLKPETPPVIDIRDSNNAVFDAVNSAYPIMTDDGNLRKIKDIENVSRGRYFDKLRKEYPVRREFFNYTLKTIKNQNPSKIKILEELGFKINE